MKKYISLLLMLAMLMSALAFTSCEDSTDLADYDIDKYIKLPQYKGVKITETVIAVSDEDVQEAVDEFMEDFAETTTLSETDAIENGDVLSITYEGYIDGEYEAFENGEMFTEQTTAYSLTIGSGAFIPGFESALIGAYPGTVTEISVTFPESYDNNPDLEGVNTKFKVNIISAKRDVYPEYNDEFVKENTEYESMEAFEAYLMEVLRAEADESELVAEIQAVWAQIVDGTEVIKVPEAIIEAQVQKTVDSYTEYATAYGMSLEDLLTNYYGTTVDTFMTEIEEECRDYVVEEMILTRIAQIEDITISDMEYSEGAEKYAVENGFTDAAALEEYYGADSIRSSLLWDKVLLFLVENADVQPATETEN